jgi:hypothetical protein
LSESAISRERRDAPDRRRNPTRAISRYTFFGRRQAFRREGESRNAYVDRYSPAMMIALVMILGLCILDALFTLLYIQRGGTELNPVMALALESGVMTFLTIKIGLTIAGILFLCLHKNFRLVRPLIGGVLVLYTLLLGYHLYLAVYV